MRVLPCVCVLLTKWLLSGSKQVCCDRILQPFVECFLLEDVKSLCGSTSLREEQAIKVSYGLATNLCVCAWIIQYAVSNFT
jgi:hypothetical protein